MSDRSGEIRRSYRRHVSRETLPYGTGLCAIPECPEEERGMWTQLMHGALSTLRYLAPATVLTIFWGHNNFLVKVLRHIVAVFRSIIYSSDKQSPLVLRWISDNSPVHVSCLEEVWRHGWLLCGLLERSLPGACGGHPRAEVSIEHAQNLVEEYLGVKPVFSQEELESTKSLSKCQEWRLTHYLEQVREALSRLSPHVPKPNTPRCPTPIQLPIQEAQAYTLDYVVRGTGLCYAQTNQKMCFKIYPTAQQCAEPGDINILIQGPEDIFGTAHVPPIYGRAQLLRQAFLGLNLKSQYTQGSLPLTQGATYLRAYGKNDMNKTFYIPKIQQDINIEVSVQRGHTRVTYMARQNGIYEISLTSRGYNLIGSPYRVVSSEESIECNTSTELYDDEECGVIDVKRDRRVVFRIVDFVTEKMILNENGSLEKITEEEAKKLISNTKPIRKVDKDESKMLKQLDLIEQDSRKDYCARTRFKAAAKSIIKLIEVCKEFKATIKKKVKIDHQYDGNFAGNSDVPDIVHSMIFDKNMHTGWNIEKKQNITIATSKSDLIETKLNANEITRSNETESQNNYLERLENCESDNEYINQHNQFMSYFNDQNTERQDMPILTTQKPIKGSSQNNIEDSPPFKIRTVMKNCQKETESELLLVNPFMSNISEIRENIFEVERKDLLERDLQSHIFQDIQGPVINEVDEPLAKPAKIKLPSNPAHKAAQSLEILRSSSPFGIANVIAADNNPLENLSKLNDDISECNELKIEKGILPIYNSFHDEQGEKNDAFINADDTCIQNIAKINNDIVKHFHDETLETENMKSQGNSITFNPFHNKSFDDEQELANPRMRNLESPIKIIVQMEDSEEIKSFTNPFIDTEIVERPKTPILNIISGDAKGRDSVYVDSNLKPPDDLSTDEELWKSNEYLNPFYVEKIYQNTIGATLHTPPLMTDFLIGAPVSLPHFLRAQSPEPNMDSIIMASTLEEALNKYDMKLQNMKQSESTEVESTFSTPVPPTPTHIIREISLEDKCKDDDSNFYSSEYYVTESTTDYTDCTNDSIKIPHRELWDSAYVSIDEPSASPDSNNNSENGYKFKTLDHEKFDIPERDFFNMGPAEREIWQTYAHENSDRADLLEQNPKLEQRSFSTILEGDEKGSPTSPKHLNNMFETKNRSDSITEVLTELNDMYKEYSTTPEKASFVLEPEKEKFESLEVRFSVPEDDNNVDSASELISDVKRHTQTIEAAAISEVQSIATESFSASQALEDSLIRKIDNASVTNNTKIFGEICSGNFVHERKKYWDEKIKEIEEMKQQQQRKRKKHLKLNDSLSKRKGKNIAKNFINAVESINSDNVRASLDNVVNYLEHVEPKNEPQTEVKIVDKWKKFWDDKLVTTENVNLFPISKKEIVPMKKSMSPVMITTPNVTTKNLIIQSDSGESSPEETLPHPEIHSPIKFDVSDEKVFKAFETSPKRFFGNSRRNILEKIDSFLGHQTSEDKKMVDVPNISSNIGIVSSRISMFNIDKAHENNVHRHRESMDANRQKRQVISEINQTSNIHDCDDEKTFIPTTDTNCQKLGTNEDELGGKILEKITNKIDRFRKSTSKSEMDLFNKRYTTSDDFNTHKSCEELYRVNVRNFISLFEHQAVQKVQSNSESTADISSPHKGVPNVSQNADSCKVLPERLVVDIPPEEIEVESNGSVIYEAIVVLDHSTPSTRHIIEEPIVHKDAKENIKETKQPDATEYKERFKTAKQFFKSLEEIRGDDGEKMQKLNECEMLLYRQTVAPNTPKLTKKNRNRPHSAPTSDCEYEPISLTDSWDGYGSGAGGRKLIKISEKFQVEDLFKDVAGGGTLTRKGSFRGIPHMRAVLATFKSMENLVDAQLSSYEISLSQLSDFANENKVKNAQTHLTEYPYLPETDPSKYRSRLDNKASGLISRKELLKEAMRPRRNSVPDALRLNERFTVHM